MQNCNMILIPQNDVPDFYKSLQELKNMRSQLYNAAEFCELKFMNAKEKEKIVKDAKEYVSQAMVTLVDHVGCVSDNLDYLIAQATTFSDANLRIGCLEQRSTLSEQYNHKLALKRLQCRQVVSRNQPRYFSTNINERERSDRDSGESNSTEAIAKSVDKCAYKRKDDMPRKPTQSKEENNNSTPLLLQRDSISTHFETQNHVFHFQEMNKTSQTKRTRRKRDLLALIRRSKRAA